MRSVRAALFLLCAAAVTAAAHDGEAVDWQDAARCVGRVCIVNGRVAAKADEEGTLRLYFDDSRRDVSVILVRSLFVTWPDYTGRDIAAKGKVRRFRDQVEIVVDHPRRIEVSGVAPTVSAEPTPSAPPTAEPPPPPPAPEPTPETQEVERLRRQVEQLEQRVRELEGEGD